MKNEELLHRAPACAVGLQTDGLGAAPRRRANCNAAVSRPDFFILHSSFAFPFSGVVQTSNALPASKLMGALPTDSPASPEAAEAKAAHHSLAKVGFAPC